MNKKVRIFTYLLSAAALALSGWLGLVNYPFYGQMFITMELGHDTPQISSLGPPSRVHLANGYQQVFEGPVYFNVRTLPWYHRAQIFITYTEQGQTLTGLGGQTAPGFNYQVIAPMVVRILGDGSKKAVFDVNLSWVYEQKNFRRFLLELEPTQLDQVGERGELQISEIRVLLLR